MVMGIGLALVAVIIAGLSGYEIGVNRNEVGPIVITGRPDSITVSRYTGPGFGPQQSPPPPVRLDGTRTITSAGEIDRILADLARLPALTGSVACPADDGSYYELQFCYDSGDRRTVYAGRHGCEIVSFAEQRSGPSAWSIPDRHLLDDLDALFR